MCGLMGHTVEECGDGVHDPNKCEWGDWILWTNDPPPPHTHIKMRTAWRQDSTGVRGGRESGGTYGTGRGSTGGRGIMFGQWVAEPR